MIELQKASLVAYTKREVCVEILECRATSKAGADQFESFASSGHESSESLPSGDMDEPLVASHGSSPAAAAAAAGGGGTWFGGKKLSKMFKSPVSMVGTADRRRGDRC